MISAKEARNISENVHPDYYQRKTIEKEILEAAHHKETFCVHRGPIRSKTKEWLESLGYTVTLDYVTHYSGCVTIEW